MTAASDAAHQAFAGIIGQAPAVAELVAATAAPVHAYLLVGPPGAGTRRLARAFSAALVADAAPGGGAARAAELALADRHPDVVVVEPQGNQIQKQEAERLRDEALKSPLEGDRKVLIATGFESMTGKASGMLLKTIEEPAPASVLVLLAEGVPDELVTIASRCVRIDVPPLAEQVICDELVAQGADPDRAASVAAASAGDLDRARVLVGDERLDLRRQAWQAVPGQLDGTGAAVHRLVDELLTMVDDAMAPLVEQQAAERADLVADQEARGGGRGAAGALDAAHKREQRRFRTGELRFGLALLARHHRDAALRADRIGPAVEAVAAIDELGAAGRYNPNDRLQLQALFLRLSPTP